MTREDIDNIISIICPNDEDFEKACISPACLKKELEALALEQKPCEDAISRQIISDYVKSHIQEINTGYGDLNEHTNRILRMIMEYIDKLPPVNQEPKTKTGHWIKGLHGFKCSKCLIVHLRTSIYCPSCGAKMVEPQEKNEQDEEGGIKI